MKLDWMKLDEEDEDWLDEAWFVANKYDTIAEKRKVIRNLFKDDIGR